MYNHNKAQQSKNRVHILGYTVCAPANKTIIGSDNSLLPIQRKVQVIIQTNHDLMFIGS